MKLKSLVFGLIAVVATAVGVALVPNNNQVNAASCTSSVFSSGYAGCVFYIQRMINGDHVRQAYRNYTWGTNSLGTSCGVYGFKTGYLAVDGSFGPATRADVKVEQSANCIKSDGIVGPQTWKALCYSAADNYNVYRIIINYNLPIADNWRLLDAYQAGRSAGCYA